MVDLYLQAMMRGDFAKKPQSAKDKENNKFDAAIDHFAKKYVDSLHLEERPENKLESVALIRQKLIEEIKELATCSELSTYLDEAYAIIYSEGEMLLGKEAYATLNHDLEQAREKIDALDLTQPIPENINDSLAIPASSLALIMQLGITKFQEQTFEASLSLFILLNTICPYEPDYSFRLGITAQKCGLYDMAYQAYRSTIMLSPTFVGARLFAAECALFRGDIEEAKRLHVEAKELMQNESIDEIWIDLSHALQDFIENPGLLNKVQESSLNEMEPAQTNEE